MLISTKILTFHFMKMLIEISIKCRYLIDISGKNYNKNK